MDLENSKSEWKTIGRPGYFGAKRNDTYSQYDSIYGKDNWRIVWKIEGHFFDKYTVCTLYEDAYFSFLKNNPSILEQLVSSASDVYDDDISNMTSGLDYGAQETNRTHIQDIAIRRVLTRLGTKFKGSEPIQIRDRLGTHPLSRILSPGQVPFHRQELIEKPELEGWWNKSSVESFYQSNKYLQVKKS